MFYTYIIKSKKNGHKYTGSTNNLRKRFLQAMYTKNRGPFFLIYYEACLNNDNARARESYLKSGIGKRYINSRFKHPLSLTG